MYCKVCKVKILGRDNQIKLEKPRRRGAFDPSSGIARACPTCGMLYWDNGPRVMKLTVNGEEWDGPVYLTKDGSVVKEPNGVAAKLPERRKKP